MKNNLSRHLALVKQGGQITVLERDKPVARIIPFLPADHGGSRENADAVVRARPEISVSFLGAEAPGSPGARREHAGRM